MSTGQSSDLATKAIVEARSSPHRQRNNTINPDEWFSIGKHIVFAAMLWPLVVYFTFASFGIYSVLAGIAPGNAFQALAIGAFAALWAVPVAGIAAAFVTGITLILAIIVYGSLRVRLPITLIGAVLGGWIGGGYMAIINFGLLGASPDFGFDLPSAIFLVLSATVMGQFGGAIGGWRSQYRFVRRPEDLTDVVRRRLDLGTAPGPIRFGLRDMLVGSAWLCGLLGATKMSGLLIPPIVVALSAWGAMQAITLLVGIWLWPRYIAWRVRRSERRPSR